MRAFLAVEGTVGSGKTSLIETMSKKLGLIPFYELSDPMIGEILEDFYHDRRRWAFTLQILFLTVRYEQIRKASALGKSVLDRSIFGDVVFARMLHRYGEMKDSEMRVYERLYRALISSVLPPFLMIYIRCPTDLAIERIEKRGREYELVVEREYWERLNSEYESYFSNYDLSPLLIVNARNYDWVESESDGDRIVGEVERYLRMSLRGEIGPGWRKEI